MILAEKNIRKWRNQFSVFNRSVKQINKMIMHSGKKPEIDNIDDEIVEWILMNRKLGITVIIY